MKRAAMATVVSAVALGALPAAARAEGCVIGGGSTAYQAALTPLITAPNNGDGPLYPGGGGAGAAREALGAQYTALWMSDVDQGWAVGLAPGALDLDAARDAIRTALTHRFTADDVTFLMRTLKVHAQPFSEAELRVAQTQAEGIVAALPFTAGSTGLGCRLSDSFRVEVRLSTGDADPTPDQQAAVAAALAPLGDKVRFQLVKGALTTAPPATGVTPPPGQGHGAAPKPVRVRSYVTLARNDRCVRASKVTVKARRKADLQLVSVVVGTRTTKLRPGRSAKVALKRRKTSFTLKVSLRNGTTGTQAFTYTRCKPR